MLFIPIIIPATESWSNVVLDPIRIKLSVAPPCSTTLFAEPTSIRETSPYITMLPSPSDIEAWVEDISILFASNSNFSVSIATLVPSYCTKLSDPLPA